MADKFEEVTGKLALVALHKTPVVNIITEIVESFLPETPDERLKEAIEAEARERVAHLQAKVERIEKELEAQGARLDDLGPMRTVNVAREYVQGCAEAHSEEKKEALTIAAARQFDPRFGQQYVRAHWLALLGELSDIEIMAILWMAGFPARTEFEFPNEYRESEQIKVHLRSRKVDLVELPETQRVAFVDVLTRLKADGRFVYTSTGFFGVTDAGRQLAAFASEGPTPAHPSG
jgi:hypothetical protein